jgi:hypothetical protein
MTGRVGPGRDRRNRACWRRRATCWSVEETNPRLEAGDAGRADLGYTRGRPVAAHAGALSPLTLLATSPRHIEPGYPRQDVGTFTFFRRS